MRIEILDDKSDKLFFELIWTKCEAYCYSNNKKGKLLRYRYVIDDKKVIENLKKDKRIKWREL